jgi:TldD protein
MQSDNLAIAKEALLAQGEISENTLERILSDMLGNTIDSADLYFQSIQQESWVLEDGIIKEGSYSTDNGVGVRALHGEKAGFAYSEDIMLPAIETAAAAAKSIAICGGQKRICAWERKIIIPKVYTPDNPLQSMLDADKIALLKKLDLQARKIDQRVQRVVVSLSGVHEIILMVATDGTWQADVRPLVRLNVSIIAEQNGRREQASCGGGGRGTYSMFLDNTVVCSYVEEAVRQALVLLDAVAAPAGTMPVVLGAGWPGILLHEAIGHGLEGDFNRKGSSAFSGRIGERIASPLCTIVDDGTLEGRRGSLNVDDEGTPSQCTTLIENGILKSYMQDKLNAKLMGSKSTGNGRRESYAYLPMPRMTNTYMLAGKHTAEEIIASVDNGLYAVNFGGGQVDITSGKFVFNASEAYLIENGKITRPVKGATLIGNGPDVLTKVTMVANDLQLDKGVGVCGKEGQSIPVGVGQPTLLINNLTVGGTQ